MARAAWRTASSLLLLVAACGRAAEAEAERESHCGGVGYEPQRLHCEEPTIEVDGGCDFTSATLSGECMPGFRVQEPSATAGSDEPRVCVAEVMSKLSRAPATAEERAIAQQVLREARERCDGNSSALAQTESLQRLLNWLPHPAIWAQLARCEESDRRVQRALLAWRHVLVSELPATPKAPSERALAELEELRRDAHQRIPALEAALSHLKLLLPADLEKPRVALDRAVYETALFESGIAVEPGSNHELLVVARGRLPRIMHVTAGQGQTVTLQASLELIDPAAQRAESQPGP